jgi:hypothetical protein
MQFLKRVLKIDAKVILLCQVQSNGLVLQAERQLVMAAQVALRRQQAAEDAFAMGLRCISPSRQLPARACVLEEGAEGGGCRGQKAKNLMELYAVQIFKYFKNSLSHNAI